MTGFTPRQLLASLKQIPIPERYLVGYSGGRDSHVLLHALAAIQTELSATIHVVHIHHGLQAAAEQWVVHCQAMCDGLGLPLQVIRVDAKASIGESPEAAARQARYAAFAELMAATDVLLTAHHQDDQAETLLLQLLRGAGPHGLASMPQHKAFATGTQLRPLLGYSRAELNDYAQQQGLTWIHDGSNDDCSFRRNYLRHQVIPALQSQWPSWSRTLSRSAALCADAAALLDDIAATDLQALLMEDEGLAVSRFLDLSANRQRNVLRYWCGQRGLPLPTQVHLTQLQQQLAHNTDQRLLISWKGAELRRYQDGLYLMAPLLCVDSDLVVDWDMRMPLDLPHGRLSLRRTRNTGLNINSLNGRLSIRFRRGGERMQLASGQHQPLKKIFQALKVPPWLRDRLPLIYLDNELIAVADICIAQQYKSVDDGDAVCFDWLLF